MNVSFLEFASNTSNSVIHTKCCIHTLKKNLKNHLEHKNIKIYAAKLTISYYVIHTDLD